MIKIKFHDWFDIIVNKKITKRTFIKKSVTTILTLTGLGFGSRYYAENIEPFWLDITHHTISHKHIPNGFSGMKIVQFSDTHLGFQYDLKHLESAVVKINNLKPDVIVFTGDLLDIPDQFNELHEISPILKKLEAPLGKYCIFGNHDHGGNGSSSYKLIMEESNFTLLQNSNRKITLSNEEFIYIAGIDDAMLGFPQWEETLQNIPKEAYSILLSHAPDFADRANEESVDLQLSGHSHGGQVQIPLIGALVTPPFAKRYYEGMYNLTNVQLYVNRGLGTTRLPYRFLSRPEISVFTLRPLK